MECLATVSSGLQRIAAFLRRAGPTGMAVILAWAAIASPALGQGLPALIQPTDLRDEATRIARHGHPMVVLYSQRGCGWCDQARTHLVPMSRRSGDGVDAIFRQIDIDSDTPLIDFDGRTTTQRRFAQTQGVRFTPTVSLYGPDGEPIGAPILGMRLPDFYGQYVENAIARARQTIRSNVE
ncbi:thioredoxin fold domain-containing protein [Rhodocyclaceae bacterium SMB388]